jgi:hypothetical protein
LRQLPDPSQVPSVAQVAAGCAAQVPRGSIVPAATGAQVPIDPGTLQALQGLQLIAWQQTPSRQLPVAHSEDLAQAAPVARRTQEPPTHTAGAAQSPSPPQAAKQVGPLHR